MMNLKQLRQLLEDLGEEHDEKTVWVEGCDCDETCGGIEVIEENPGSSIQAPIGTLLLLRGD